MNRLAKLLGAIASVTLLAGCVTDNSVYEDGYYAPAPRYTADYDNSCDYYNPPWGYPADYCRYQTWNEPVYYGGIWYSGPIYYRNYAGANWFWLNGDWRRDEWRGQRPAIDWNRNRYWRGEVVHARNEFRDRRDVGDRRDDNRRDFGSRNFDNDGRGRDERDFRGGGQNNQGQNNQGQRNGDNNGRFGGRGPGNQGNMERANYGPPPGSGGAQNPQPNTVQGGRFDARGPRNATANNPPPANAQTPPLPRAARNGDTEVKAPARPQGQGLVGGLARGRAAATDKDDDNNKR
jgi:hypothetical protein